MLKRMESALVRKDAVMLHDPMGTHNRATIVGVVLACIGVIGFLVWGLFGGKGSVPDAGSVVIGKDSGSVYVVTKDDEASKRLIPMLNIASAKLLVMAQSGDGGYSGGPIEPTTVKESALAEFPRGPRTGIVNAPVYLPDASNIAQSSWAICDVGQVKGSLSEEQIASSTKVHTTVIGGDGNHGEQLAENESLYVKDQSSGKTYLVYRVRDGIPGQPNTTAVKAEVTEESVAVTEMFGLVGQTPRTISTNMLNAIPEVSELKAKTVTASPLEYMSEYESGDVVKRTVAGKEDQYFLLLTSGKQQLSEGAAAVQHAANEGSTEIPDETGRVTQVPDAERSEMVDMVTFPTKVPKPVGFQESDSSCLSWKSVNGEHRINVTLSNGSPTDKAPVKLAQADGSGRNVDNFYMPPGKAAVVRKTTSEAGSGKGPIALVSDQGVQYGVKNAAVASGLGVVNGGGDIKDAPPGIIQALPEGGYLDPAEASYTYDSIDVPPGSSVNRPPKQEQQAAG